MAEITTDLRQRHIEKWALVFEPHREGDERHIVAYHGDNVRACIEAGIITGLTADEVDDMRVPDIADLSKRALTVINDAFAPPKKTK